MSQGPSGPLSEDALALMRVPFLQECAENLSELEAGLLALRDGAGGCRHRDLRSGSCA